jgi:DNA-directed RNA polymerase subunit RPC12/RpoP
MSYIMPAPYKCIKCGFEFNFTPHNTHSAPVLQREIPGGNGIYQQSMPICPKCWAKFLMDNVGIAYATTTWTKDGSDYENALKEQNERA